MPNMEDLFYYARLITRYINDELTVAELEALSAWIAADERHFQLFEELTRVADQPDAVGFMEEVDIDKAWKKVLHSKPDTHPAIVPADGIGYRKHPLSVRRIAYASVAAAVLLFAILFLRDAPDPADPVSIAAVEPGGNKAILTLSNGKVIDLDGVPRTGIDDQGGAKLIAVDGQLQYMAAVKDGEIQYNSVQTPRGGKYQLILADGTKVWLNASSRLRFPVVFSGAERRVELQGEGYFEVSKNKNQPFRVTLNNGATIQVLGTSFNINAYPDETAVKTTLFEGKIAFAKDDVSSIVMPGQQVSLLGDAPEQQKGFPSMAGKDRMVIANDVDLEQVVAWKNDLFIFNSQRVSDIMRQISRWYDLDVQFVGQPSNETFSGIVSSKSNLGQVLKIMEESGMRFRIEEKTLIIF